MVFHFLQIILAFAANLQLVDVVALLNYPVDGSSNPEKTLENPVRFFQAGHTLHFTPG